jgi:hypothetical protein
MHYTANEIHLMRKTIAVILAAEKPINSYGYSMYHDYAYGYNGISTTSTERAIQAVAGDAHQRLVIETMLTTYMTNETTHAELEAEADRLTTERAARLTAFQEEQAAARKAQEQARLAAEAKAEKIVVDTVSPRKRRKFGR